MATTQHRQPRAGESTRRSPEPPRRFSKLSRLASRVRRDIRSYGLLKTSYELLMESINLFVDFRVIKVFRLDKVDPDYLRSDEPVEWAFFNEEQLLAFARQPGSPMDEEFVRTAVAKGDQCYGAVDGGQLMCCTWFAATPTDDGGLTFCFPHDHVYIYKGYTSPASRGRRLVGVSLHRGLAVLFDRGFQGVFYMISAHNYPSLHVIKPFDCEHLGYIVALKIRRAAWIFNSRGCRAHGCSLVKPGDIASVMATDLAPHGPPHDRSRTRSPAGGHLK